MSRPTVRNTLHTVDVDAPPELVYGLLADATQWPHLFPPTVHVIREDAGPQRERLRIWALADGRLKSWTSLRELPAGQLHIAFRQEVSAPPVGSMAGSWEITARAGGGSRIVLGHRFTAVADDPDGLRWIEEATDRNSTSELASLRAIAEEVADGTRHGELLLSFEDSVLVQAPPQVVHDFLDRADLWPQRLAHVARVALTEDEPGQQVLEMDTRAPDGTTHTTRSFRVSLAPHTLAYKQTTLPDALTVHTGRWVLDPYAEGDVTHTRATSRHTVRLHPERAIALPGVRTLADARAAVRAAIGGNSLATLRTAKQHLESARLSAG
ncbi:aromatase/cyclase [Candidatus Protofrankia californiensis]|uniref:aromatase/cyclase n=1 Tax=Candidatus Protofrankia californiensis TaxID=1839754 RepID=UPI001041544F|nr:aromatase/cyclase [Candidatus Protofrankia californiensis]